MIKCKALIDTEGETRSTKNAKDETLMGKVEKELVKVTQGSIMFLKNPPKITTPLPYPSRTRTSMNNSPSS